MSRPTRESRLVANLRPPPAYQEYGSDLLNLETLTLMSLAERGLLATMRWKIWANDSLPRDPEALAKLLGLEVQAVRANLSERVLTFFAQMDGNHERLICPELAAQKSRIMEQREKQAIGSSKGGKATRDKRKSGAPHPAGNPEGEPVGNKLGDPIGSEMSRTELQGTASTGRADIPTDQEVESMQRAFGEIF